MAVRLTECPEDVGARVIAAEVMEQLGLRTLGMEMLEGLDGMWAGAARALRARLSDLPSEVVPSDQRIEMARNNLGELHARGICTDVEFGRWERRTRGMECFRARDGNILRRTTGMPAGSIGWLRNARDLRGEACEGVKVLGQVECVCGVVMEGIDPPWLLEEFFRCTQGRAGELAARLFVVVGDAMVLLDALSVADLRHVLRSARVEVFAGPGAGVAFARRIGESLDCVLPEVLGVLPGSRGRVEPLPGESLRRARAEQAALIERLAGLVRQRDGARTVEYWRGRWAGDRLRVLIPCTRHSTFVGRSAGDLARALRAGGHEVLLLQEPDEHSLLSALAHLRALWEFDPDLVAAINVTRARTRGVYPPNVPYVAWVQDADPGLFEDGTGCRQGPTDFLAGHMLPELFERFGFDRGKAMPAGVPACARTFHDGPVGASLCRRLECEVAFVSHHAGTPEHLHERLVREVGEERLARVFGLLFADIGDAVGRMNERSPTPVIRESVRRRLREVLGREPEARVEALVLRQYALPMGERMARHQMLGWAARIVRRRGWRMHLYGRGWEDVADLCEFARGSLDDGETLRAAYRSARASLHASVHTLAHQRVLECALAGGLTLCRYMPDALAARRAAVLAALVGREPDVRRGTAVGYFVDAHEEARTFADLAARVGEHFGEAGVVWVEEVGIEKARAEVHERGPEQDACVVLGDLPASVFRDEAELESLLERCVGDDAWRDGLARAQRSGAMRVGTYDLFAQRLLAHVHAGLVRGVDAAGGSK
jgi:hypothetical protein